MRSLVDLSCLALSGALLLSGCLGSTYRIPKEEMQRLSELPPQERSQHVRVVQLPEWDTHAPLREPEPIELHHHHIVVHHSGHGGGCRGGCRGAARPHGASGGKGGPAKEAPVRRGGSGGKAPSIPVGDSKALAVIVVAGGVFLTVGLVATEGARYDGWVGLEEDHPVHLLQYGGGYRTLSLSQVQPSDLRDTRRVLINSRQGAVLHLERAPLDRRGLTWKMYGGGVPLLTAEGAQGLFPGATMEFGYFFHQKVGLVGTLSLAGGSQRGGDVFGSRYGLELQALPLDLGRLHLGGYGQLGEAYDASEGGGLTPHSEVQTFYGAGGMVELEVTTRMALVARSGLLWWNGPDRDQGPAWVTSFGVAIY